MLNWIIWNKTVFIYNPVYCAVGWDCRIHQLHLCLDYDIKQADGEGLEMLELWWMQSVPSLPLLQGLLWPGVVAPDRTLSIGQIEINSVFMLNWIAWNRTVFDIETGLC